MLQAVYNIFNVFAILFIVLAGNDGIAVNMPQQCVITPEISLLQTPPKPHKSNNLRRMQHKTEFAQGQPILITGMVLDAACVPIGDAVVEIWQANAMGGIDYIIENENVASVNQKKNLDEYFAGSGMTVTDNFGRYHFLTVMPGTLNDSRSPHVNVRIRHSDFGTFESVIYFEHQHLNEKDSVLRKYVPVAKRKLLIAENSQTSPEQDALPQKIAEEFIVYKFNITLPMQHRYKTY